MVTDPEERNAEHSMRMSSSSDADPNLGLHQALSSNVCACRWHWLNVLFLCPFRILRRLGALSGASSSVQNRRAHLTILDRYIQPVYSTGILDQHIRLAYPISILDNLSWQAHWMIKLDNRIERLNAVHWKTERLHRPHDSSVPRADSKSSRFRHATRWSHNELHYAM